MLRRTPVGVLDPGGLRPKIRGNPCHIASKWARARNHVHCRKALCLKALAMTNETVRVFPAKFARNSSCERREVAYPPAQTQPSSCHKVGITALVGATSKTSRLSGSYGRVPGRHLKIFELDGRV
jgi:hypothetical protein